MATSEKQARLNSRRRHLENLLMQTTGYLPHQAGLTRHEFNRLKLILARRIPSDEVAMAADDIARRNAVLETIAARTKAGFDEAKQETTWRYIVSLPREATHYSMLDQTIFIIDTLVRLFGALTTSFVLFCEVQNGS